MSNTGAPIAAAMQHQQIGYGSRRHDCHGASGVSINTKLVSPLSTVPSPSWILQPRPHTTHVALGSVVEPVQVLIVNNPATPAAAGRRLQPNHGPSVAVGASNACRTGAAAAAAAAAKVQDLRAAAAAFSANPALKEEAESPLPLLDCPYCALADARDKKSCNKRRARPRKSNRLQVCFSLYQIRPPPGVIL